MDCQNSRGLGERTNLRGKGWRCSGMVAFVCSLETLICSLVAYKEIAVLSFLAVIRTLARACHGSWH